MEERESIMRKVSIIVPCLNMERYINSCLESVMCQTLEDLEILVVDAGSTDGTGEILNKLAERDDRIQIICSGKKSYGYQVNLGIKYAHGRYIAIVDADDKVAPNMYETLYRTAVESGADYVKGTAKRFYTIADDLIYELPLVQFPKQEYVEKRICLAPMDRPDLLTKDNFLWYGIFKQGFMKDIRFHESPGAAFQDLGGLLQTQMKAESAVYLQEPFYEYRQDNMGASVYNIKGFEFIWNEYTWAEQFIVNASAGWKAAFYRKFFLHTLDRYYAMGASGGFWSSAEIYIGKIREKLKTVISEKIITMDLFTENEQENLGLFFRNGYALYAKCSEQYTIKKKQMISIAAAVKDRKIVIFGCGQLGMFVHAQLLKHNLGGVTAYCDNGGGNKGKYIWNVPVLKPLEAVRLYPGACFVLATSRHQDEMRKQLMETGIAEKQILYYTAGMDMGLFGDRIV